MEFLSYLISGISLGSVYALIALGYTMVYGIAKMLNFAHGDVIMIGGYISFCTVSYLGLPVWLAVLLAMAVCTVLGISGSGWPTSPCALPLPGSADHRHWCQLFPAKCRPAAVGRRQYLLPPADHRVPAPCSVAA